MKTVSQETAESIAMQFWRERSAVWEQMPQDELATFAVKQACRLYLRAPYIGKHAVQEAISNLLEQLSLADSFQRMVGK